METFYLTVPGYGNSDEHHWQSYFEKKLIRCLRIPQKNWDHPICEDWINSIQEKVSSYHHYQVVLISHSLGGIAIAHWAEKFHPKIKAAFIVAPPDIENPYSDLGLESFLPIPNNKFPFPSLIVGSTNDHWATTERTKEFAKNWGSDLTFIGDAGHINSTSGHGQWEEGIMLLDNFIKTLSS